MFFRVVILRSLVIFLVVVLFILMLVMLYEGVGLLVVWGVFVGFWVWVC